MLDHGTLESGHVDPKEAFRHRMRHSAAHVMADAVLKLFRRRRLPSARLPRTVSTMTLTSPAPSPPKT